jgi:hypothetical protein
LQEEHRVRQKILEELRAAGQADEDADVKVKQAEAKRAALLYKLKQAEFAAGMSTPQPLGRQVGSLGLLLCGTPIMIACIYCDSM